MTAWFLRALGAALAFVSFFVIIRYTNPRTASQYAQAWALGGPISLLTLGGIQVTVMRFAGKSLDPLQLHLVVALRIFISAACLVAIAFWLSKPIALATPNLWLAWTCAIFVATATFLPEYYKARLEFNVSQIVLVLLNAIWFAAAIVTYHVVGLHVDTIAIVMLLPPVTVWVASLTWTRRRDGQPVNEAAKFPYFQFDVRSTAVFLMTSLLLGYDVLAVSLSGFYGEREIVTYAAAARIAQSFSILVGLAYIRQPATAMRLLQDGRVAECQAFLRKDSTRIFAIGLLVFVSLALAAIIAPASLSKLLVGFEDEQLIWIAVVLSIGYLINLYTGVRGYLLLVMGKANPQLRISASCAALTVASISVAVAAKMPFVLLALLISAVHAAQCLFEALAVRRHLCVNLLGRLYGR